MRIYAVLTMLFIAAACTGVHNNGPTRIVTEVIKSNGQSFLAIERFSNLQVIHVDESGKQIRVYTAGQWQPDAPPAPNMPDEYPGRLFVPGGERVAIRVGFEPPWPPQPPSQTPRPPVLYYIGPDFNPCLPTGAGCGGTFGRNIPLRYGIVTESSWFCPTAPDENVRGPYGSKEECELGCRIDENTNYPCKSFPPTL